MRNNTFHQKCRSLVDAGSIDVVLFQIALLDLSVCKNNSREDQQRQVEVSEDCVTGGYKLNDTDLGSCCACEQKYDYEKTVQAITPERLCDFVKEVLKAGNEAEIVMLPAE